MEEDSLGASTRLLRAGRPHVGWVNTPVTRASTYVFESISHWRQTRAVREEQRVASYGARGTDSTFALEDALVELEGGHRAQLFPTGQAAIATMMLGLLQPGDHVLVTDAVYEPVRRFCAQHLTRLGSMSSSTCPTAATSPRGCAPRPSWSMPNARVRSPSR